MNDSQNASLSARGPSCATGQFTTNDDPSMKEILPLEFDELRKQKTPHVLVDVRVPEQFDLCALDGAVNIRLREIVERIEEVEELSNGTVPVYCICRRGVASIDATRLLGELRADHPKIHSVTNVKGGLDEWRRTVD